MSGIVSEQMKENAWHQVRKPVIASALRQSSGNLTQAARDIGISRNTMRKYARQFGFISKKNGK